MSKEITISIDDLESMLREQKLITMECLRNNTGYWNNDSDESNYRMVNINKAKFEEQAIKSRYPDTFNTLKKYVK